MALMPTPHRNLDTPRTKPERIVFLDVLRLVAAVQMIQGHTLDALLADRYRQGPWFQAWTFVRGLTSTTFLVCAGMAFALAVQNGAARGRVGRLKRAATLIVIGYAMHAPFGALFGEPWAAALRGFLAIDVLQCIGVSLLLLELGAACLSDPHWLAAASAAFALGCFTLAPWADRATFPEPARALTNYLTAQHGSLFPLLPWAGFVGWGSALGTFTACRIHNLGSQSVALRLLGVALVSSAGAALHGRLLNGEMGRVSMGLALLRLGLVLLLAAALVCALEGRVKLSPLLRRLASETLFLYVSHVLLLYAGVIGLATLVGHTLSLGGALCVAVTLLVGCSISALAYRRAREALRARGGGGTPRALAGPKLQTSAKHR